MESSNVLYGNKAPVSFLRWLELQERVSDDFDINFKLYQNYITDWLKSTNKNVNVSDNFFTGLYVDLMRELTLNFSTEEEKRYIVNFDYTKKENIDTIIPFFVNKLKALCLYYSNRRENLKNKISSVAIKGTNLSIIKTVKDIILSEINSGKTQKVVEGKTTIPALSSVNQFLDVTVEELYDDTNYFDPNNKNNNLGVYPIDKNLYTDFSKAIISAIEQYPIFIDSLKYNLSVNLSFSGNELEFLKERDFINYIKSEENTDLKINLLKQIAPKYLSSNFYYLSVGDTLTDISSGVLFKPGEYNGSLVQNSTNRNYSSVAYVQNIDNLYSAYEMGKFFIPSKLGILLYSAPKKSFSINLNKLTPNSVYVFPDPLVSESEDTIYSSYPIVYKVVLDWCKLGPEAGFCFGDVLTDKHYQRFYSYESMSQEVIGQPYGLSLSMDNVDFWSGEESSIWTEGSLWPGLDKVEKLSLDQRTDSLLINKGIPVDWYSDLYGNEFGLYKNLNVNFTLSDKKYKLPGKLYVKNTTSGLVSSFHHHFKSLVQKYPNKIAQEMQEDIFSFFVIKNLIVIETKNYVTVDSYDFDYGSKSFINTLLPGVFIPKYKINSHVEKYINCFYVEKTEDLFLCFTQLLPTLSASNYKSIYPVIYKVNTNKLNLEQLYPVSKFNATIYSLSSIDYKEFAEVDLRYLEGGKFSYNERLNLFNLTYYAYNLNNIPFIVNEQFSYNNETNTLYSFVPILNKPYYYVNDVNFSNPNLNFDFKFTSSYSENVGSKDRGNFRWGIESINKENFHFNSTINPVYINVPGTHFVQFDFDQYIYGNVYIGCESIGVTKVDDKNIIDFRNGSPIIIMDREETWYKVSDYYFNNLVYTLSAKRPYNTNNSIIQFSISSSLTSDKNIFCNNLATTYRTVSVLKTGTGRGVITSKPFCIDCGDVCSFLYPINSSITLTPSAAKDSFFSGWKGSDCEGLASSCFLTVTDNTLLTAFFNTVPFYTLRVVSTLPTAKIISTDGRISYPLSASALYKQDSLVVLSASDELGYIFKGFLGSNCGENNPCGNTMLGNITLTARYVKSENIIEIHNKRQNNEPGQGIIYCSIDPLTPITTFASLTAPTNTVVTISSVPFENFVFRGFNGSPCEGIQSDTCVFRLTNNRSITGSFSRPLIPISVETYGSGVFYVASEDGQIDYGTFNLRNEKNKKTALYTSGTFVSLTGIGIGDTGIVSLCTGDYNVFSGALDGDQELPITFMATRALTVSAVALADLISYTVSKSGNDEVFYYQNTVTFNEYVMDNNTVIKTILDYRGNIINFNIYNELFPAYNRLLYVIGNTGLYYNMESVQGNPINFLDLNNTPISNFKIRISDEIINFDNDSIMSVEINDGAPYYSDYNNIIDIDYSTGVESVLYNSNLSSIVVYQAIN